MLAHDGDLVRAVLGTGAFLAGLGSGFKASRGRGRHVKQVARVEWSAVDAAATVLLAGVAVEGRGAQQGGGLAVFETAEVGHVRAAAGSIDGTDAGNGKLPCHRPKIPHRNVESNAKEIHWRLSEHSQTPCVLKRQLAALRRVFDPQVSSEDPMDTLGVDQCSRYIVALQPERIHPTRLVQSVSLASHPIGPARILLHFDKDPNRPVILTFIRVVLVRAIEVRTDHHDHAVPRYGPPHSANGNLPSPSDYPAARCGLGCAWRGSRTLWMW